MFRRIFAISCLVFAGLCHAQGPNPAYTYEKVADWNTIAPGYGYPFEVGNFTYADINASGDVVFTDSRIWPGIYTTLGGTLRVLTDVPLTGRDPHDHARIDGERIAYVTTDRTTRVTTIYVEEGAISSAWVTIPPEQNRAGRYWFDISEDRLVYAVTSRVSQVIGGTESTLADLTTAVPGGAACSRSSTM